MKNFEKIINTAWDRKEKISQNSHISIIKTINQISTYQIKVKYEFLKRKITNGLLINGLKKQFCLALE